MELKPIDLDPKSTAEELKAQLALIEYLGKTTFIQTLKWTCAQ